MNRRRSRPTQEDIVLTGRKRTVLRFEPLI